MSIGEERPSYALDDSVDEAVEPNAISRIGRQGLARRLLGHIAFVMPIVGGVAAMHEVYPGTESESAAGAIGLVVSIAATTYLHRTGR